MITHAGADIETRVRAVMKEVTRRDASAIAADDDLVETFGIDSLEGLQILAGIEKRFGIRIPDDELIQMRTIRRISEAVARLQGDRS